MPLVRELPPIISLIKEGGKAKYVVLRVPDYQKFVSSLTLVGGVDEAHYVAKNPDVLKAIQGGSIKDGSEHYRKYGYFEGRPAKRV